MARSSTKFCTLCQEDDVSTPAVSWCLECEDWLCTDCETHHGRSKTSKHHKSITVSVYDTLPPSVLKISAKCTLHHERFERFCSFHGVPCCIQCVSETHKECELSLIADVLQNVKESVALSHLERDLHEIQENLEVVEKHLGEKMIKVDNQKQHCLNEIKLIRASINERLDKMERNILDELSQKEIDIKERTELLASQIDSKKRDVAAMQESLLKTKQYASDLQIYLSIRQMEKHTSKNARYLESLETGDIMADKSLELVVSPALKTLQLDGAVFGTISVNSTPSTLKLSSTKHGQAVLSTIDKVTSNLSKILTITFSGRTSRMLTTCVILPTMECVFADYGNDRLVLYDSLTRKYVRDVVQTIGQIHDMCYIKDNIIGVAFPTGQKVLLIDVSKNKIVKNIQMKNRCSGIDCDSAKIFVRLPEKGTVVIMDLNGKIEQHVHIAGPGVTNIACYKNNIYCADVKTNEVLCYDMNGRIVWKQKYSALMEPMSIAIDKKSDMIYIAGCESNNILAISLDGDQSRIVLSKENGLNRPISVHISTDNKLLVLNGEGGSALVYKL